MNSFAQFEQRRGKSAVKSTPQTAKNYSSKTSNNKNFNTSTSLEKETIWRILYSNSLKAGDNGYYGFGTDGIDTFAENVGLSMSMTTDLFLVDFKYMSMNLEIGPNISMPLTLDNKARITIPVMFDLLTCSDAEDNTKSKVYCGLTLNPHITYFVSDKVGLEIGGRFNKVFATGSKFSRELCFGIIF